MRCYKGILIFIILTYGFPSSASHTLGTFPQGKASHKQSSPSFTSIPFIGKTYIEPRHYGGVFGDKNGRRQKASAVLLYTFIWEDTVLKLPLRL